MANEPLAEDPNIVIGGPDGAAVTPVTPADSKPGEPKSEEPFYRGFIGDIKGAEEAKEYIKNLEHMVVEAQAKSGVKVPTGTQNFNTPTKVVSGKEKFTDLIYSNPDQAYDVVLQDAEQRVQQRIDAKQRQDQFWTEFYHSHEDLKESKQMIDYIVKARELEIQAMPSNEAVADFLAKEARKVVEPWKKKFSGTETRLESRPAVAFGSSGEAPPAPSTQVSGPISFADQIKKINRRKK